MQPLLMKDLAAELDLHESTVSRVVANKHMVCAARHLRVPAFLLRRSSRPTTAAPSRHRHPRHDQEAGGPGRPAAPLSDNHITQELVNRGIRVARRTVAKYRESMTIPPAHERRRPDSR